MNKKPNKCLTQAQGIAIIESFYKSGLKQKEFCKLNNIACHIIQYWKPIYHKQVNVVPKAPKFLPVKIIEQKDVEYNQVLPIKIMINSAMTIEVPARVDLTTLKNVIEACKSCG